MTKNYAKTLIFCSMQIKENRIRITISFKNYEFLNYIFHTFMMRGIENILAFQTKIPKKFKTKIQTQYSIIFKCLMSTHPQKSYLVKFKESIFHFIPTKKSKFSAKLLTPILWLDPIKFSVI